MFDFFYSNLFLFASSFVDSVKRERGDNATGSADAVAKIFCEALEQGFLTLR